MPLINSAIEFELNTKTTLLLRSRFQNDDCDSCESVRASVE